MTTTVNHIAIIMDGNGRWANNRMMPRYHGHSAGAEAAKRAIKAAVKNKIKYLTLFAFSSENTNRPIKEINFLRKIFYKNLTEQLQELHKNNIKIKFIGEISYFGEELNTKMAAAVELTQNNTGLVLTVALNYGGRWDILQACKKALNQQLNSVISAEEPRSIRQDPGSARIALDRDDTTFLSLDKIDEKYFSSLLSTGDAPEPDLLIRTGYEKRISNFLIWQLAYAELYFLDKFWPDFTEDDFNKALEFYANRQRRFGTAKDLIAEAD